MGLRSSESESSSRAPAGLFVTQRREADSDVTVHMATRSLGWQESNLMAASSASPPRGGARTSPSTKRRVEQIQRDLRVSYEAELAMTNPNFKMSEIIKRRSRQVYLYRKTFTLFTQRKRHTERHSASNFSTARVYLMSSESLCQAVSPAVR